MYTTLDWLQEDAPAPKSNYTTLDWIEEDKPEPPESQKRAEALGRQHADEIFAGKFKTRTGVPIVDDTVMGDDGIERQAIPRKVWWGNAPPTPGDPAARKPLAGRRDVDAFINRHVNLGDLRDQNPQFDEPAYRREMAKRYNELYGGKVAGDLAEQDKTPAGKVFRALDYVTERLPTTGTLMPNREQRIRAAGAGLVTGEANARDIEDSVLYAQEQEAAKNRGVGGMVLETLSRAPAFIAEVETLGGLAGATAIAGGARAAQNYASGESALDAAKGFGREAITNAAFGAIGAAPGLNAGKRAAARADAGLPTTLGTLARDWAIDTPKVVAASNIGQELSYQAGLNPQGAPEGSAVKRVLQGDPHAKKELLAEVLAMGALEGGTRIPSALGILRNGPIPAPQKPPEPAAAATPAVEPVATPATPEAKIVPPVERPTEPTDQNGRTTSDLPPAEPPRPAQTATEPGQGTSIKNASMERDRAALGLSELPDAEKKKWDVSIARARERNLPETADALAKSIVEKPRTISDEEVAGLTIRATELKNARAQLERQFDQAPPGSPEAKAIVDQIERVRADFDTLSQATKFAGTEQGRSLAARKMELGEDFSILAVERDLKMAATKAGKPLDPAVLKTAVEKAKKLAEGEAAIEAMKNPTPESIIEQAAAESNNATKKPLGQSKAPKVSWTEERIKGLEAKAAESSKKLKDILSRLNSGVDPEIVVHLSNIALAKIARGSYNAAKFTADIVKEFGEKARKYAGQAWEAAVQQASEKVEKATAKAKDKIAAGELDPGLTKLLRDVLRGITQRRISAGENVKGTEARESIVGEVHSLFPEIDRPTLEDAISGIGKFRPLSKDEVSVAVRDIQGQLQQLGKLRYLAKGEMPPRTGTEKRDPSVTELDLQKQYKDLLRESGIEATSPDQLRSTKDAIKARYQHDIESMDRQIAEGEKLDRTRAKPLSDPEIDALKAKRAEKKAEYDAIFGDPTVSPEAQAEKLITSLNKQVNAIKAQIESGNIYPDRSAADAARAKRADLASTQPGVADATQRLNDLKQWRENLRNSDVPRLIEERLTALRKQKENLERRIATHDVGVDPKVDKVTDERIKRIEYENDLLRQDIRTARRELEPKSLYKKVVETLNLPRPIQMGLEYSFAGIQGGLLTANAGLRNPAIVVRTLRDTVRAMQSDRVAWEIEKRIFDSPRAPEYRMGKLALTRRDSPKTAREETFLSRGLMNMGLGKIKSVPLLGGIINTAGGVARGFERATNTYLNTIRAETFDHMADAIAGKGKPLSKQQAEMIGSALNVLSGRGEMGRFANAVEDLNTMFLAPRFAVAQIQTVIGQPMWKPLAKGEYKVAREIAKTYLRGMAGLAALQGFISMFADEVETDPRSSQFGAAKFGESTINVIPQMKLLSLAYRLTVGEKKSPLHGGIIPLRGENARRDIGDELASYVRGKLSPVVGGAYSLWKGKDIAGKDATLAKELSRMIIPITGKDITDVAQSDGVPTALALAIPAFFGANLSTIRPEEEDALKHQVVPLSSNKPVKKPLEARDAYDARVAKWAEQQRQASVITRKGNVSFDSAKEALIDQWKKTGRSTALYRDGKPTELKNRIDRLKTLLP